MSTPTVKRRASHRLKRPASVCSTRILALNLGMTIGWAHSDGGSGAYYLRPMRNGARWVDFSDWLGGLLLAHPADAVVFEQPQRRGRTATPLVAGLVVEAERIAELHSAWSRGYFAATIARHATGKCTATKRAVCAAVMKRNPERDYFGDSEMGALALLDLVLSRLQAEE